MAVEFELDGQRFVALNGGPQFKFSEAISSDPLRRLCGWLKDRHGLSWQVVPKVLFEMLVDPDQAKSQRVKEAFLQMKKFDIAALKRVYAGQN